MKGISRAVTRLLAVAALVAAPAVAPAEAEAATSLVAAHSGKCVDVPGGSTATSTQLIQYGCHGGANQSFDLVASGAYYLIRNRASGLCLNIRGNSTANGAEVIQWTCGAYANEQFTLRGNATSGYELVARHSGKCVDVPRASTANSVKLIQYACNGGSNQKFRAPGGTGVSPAPSPSPSPAPSPSPSVSPVPSPSPSPSATPVASASTIRIVSFNVKRARMASFSTLASFIASQDADVVITQENPSDYVGFGTALNNATGESWDVAWGGADVAIYSRLPIISRESRRIGLSSFSPYYRVGVRVQVSVGGRPVQIFGTHLDIGTDWGAGHVVDNMSNLLSWASTFPGTKMIGGDFNAEATAGHAGQREAIAMIRAAGYVDTLVETYGSEAAVPNTDHNGWRPDATYRNSGFRTISSRVVPTGSISDHDLILTELGLQ